MASSDCDRLRPYLVDFVVGEVDPSEARREEIEAHLAECSECRSIAEELRGTGRALEAVRSFDTKLREEVRRSITSRARVEAQLVRATREHQRIAAGRGARAVPAAAWIILALGALVAAVIAVALPRLGIFGQASAGKVLTCAGDGLKKEWPRGRELTPGQSISVPADCILCLSLSDGSRADMCGPAEVKLARGKEPFALIKGRAYVEAEVVMVLHLHPLKRLRLESGSKVSLAADPVAEVGARVTVLSGGADYAATDGDGRVEAGKTLKVDARSRRATVADMQESERPHWRKPLEIE